MEDSGERRSHSPVSTRNRGQFYPKYAIGMYGPYDQEGRSYVVDAEFMIPYGDIYQGLLGLAMTKM